MKTVRIGAGAGFSGDRIEPAVELAEHGNIDYLVFECLAERTISIAQHEKQKDPEGGYDPLLERRMRAVLPICKSKGIKIITNMGAANPIAAARLIQEIALSLDLPDLKIAAVTGDDVLGTVEGSDLLLDSGVTPIELGEKLISANAYLGAGIISDALGEGADVVISGRLADPALFLGPMVHEFGWDMSDWNLLGQGTVVGHLLECAGQVTGGYFADPGIKDIDNLARLGFPIGEVKEDGSAVLTKVEGSGGKISAATVKEQLLYEIHDPKAYLQPDVIADFSEVCVEQIAPDRVNITGGKGRAKTGFLKTSIGYHDSYVGEGQLSYAGPGALERARLAVEIVRERLLLTGIKVEETKFDLMGVDAIHGQDISNGSAPHEVRIRIVGRTADYDEAVKIGNEVEALYTNGPAGGGGAWKTVRKIIAVASVLIPEVTVKPTITLFES